MLKIIKQISLSLACMILLLHAMIPHHHHPGKPVCIESMSHQDCDNHTTCCDFGAPKNNHHDFDKGNCIIDDLFAPKDNYEAIAMTMAMANDTPNLDLVFCTLMSLSDDTFMEKGKDFRRSELDIIYKNPSAISNVGLRAPPVAIDN